MYLNKELHLLLLDVVVYVRAHGTAKILPLNTVRGTGGVPRDLLQLF